MIEKEKFRKYDLEENKTDIISVKHNSEDRSNLEQIKELLHQDKDSTAYKQAVEITLKVLLEDKIMKFRYIVLNNYRRNKRIGITDYELKLDEEINKSKTENED